MLMEPWACCNEEDSSMFGFQSPPRVYLLALLVLCESCVGLRAVSLNEDAVALCRQIAADPESRGGLVQLKDLIKVTADSDARIRLSVFYCLGCVSASLERESAAVRAYLEREYPEHPQLVYLSPRYTSDLCAFCEGRGFDPKPCTKCGEGGVCQLCGGSGNRKAAGLDGTARKCLTCKGTGRCPECDGTGEEHSGCLKCGGRGHVISKPRIRATLRELAENSEVSTDVAPSLRRVSLAILLAKADDIACKRGEAQTSILKNDIDNETRRFLERECENADVVLTSEVKDVSMVGEGIAEVRLNGLPEVSGGASSRQALRVTWSPALRILASVEDARLIRPDMKVVATGKVRFSRNSGGMIQISLLNTIGGALGSIAFHDYTCRIGTMQFRAP